MPTNTAKIKISELIEKYHIHFEGTDGYQIEKMISELADFYGLSKQAVKMRIREMGYAKVDGAFTYVNGQYVTPFSFDASALTDNQSFTISSADLFKAYCLNKDFRKAIDTGKFVYVEGHVCLGDEKYIIHSDGRVKLTQYALHWLTMTQRITVRNSPRLMTRYMISFAFAGILRWAFIGFVLIHLSTWIPETAGL